MLKIHRFATTLLLPLVFLFANRSEAKLLQIIYTGDLHSQFEPYEFYKAGGYGRIKVIIDSIKKNSAENGIPVVTLDSGDFTEGSPMYFANRGEDSWKMMGLLGYDAVTIGNHDWLTGPKELDRLIGQAPEKVSFLGANFRVPVQYTETTRRLLPYTTIHREGLKIAIFGITTDQWLFKWRAKDVKVLKPLKVASKLAPALSKQADIVIALSHLGIKGDMDLLRYTKGIDVVVGGHSHTYLGKPVVAIDPNNRKVPIVHADHAGRVIGSLLIDVDDKKNVKILKSELIPVKSSGPTDQEIEREILTARKAFEKELGSEWLKKTIGHSDTKLIVQRGSTPTIWNQIVVDSLKDAIHADAAIDVGPLNGTDQLEGRITPEKVLGLYPRVFDFNQRYGWTIWEAEVSGLWLWLAMEIAVREDEPLVLSGLELKTRMVGKKAVLTKARIGGKKIKFWKTYRIALPEGLGMGAKDISPWFKLILKNIKPTNFPMLWAIEDYLANKNITALYPVNKYRPK